MHALQSSRNAEFLLLTLLLELSADRNCWCVTVGVCPGVFLDHANYRVYTVCITHYLYTGGLKHTIQPNYSVHST